MTLQFSALHLDYRALARAAGRMLVYIALLSSIGCYEPVVPPKPAPKSSTPSPTPSTPITAGTSHTGNSPAETPSPNVSTTSVVTTPLAATPLAATPLAATPIAATPIVTTSVVTTPVATTPVATTPVATTPVAPTPVVIPTVTTGVIATPPVPVVPLEYFGLHMHRADNGTPWPTATFGSWRLWDAYAQWTHMQPSKVVWDFARLDRYVTLAQTNNVSLLLPLGLSPRWASARPNEESAYGPGHAAEPALIEDWRVYVRTVAQRYKGKINAFEIWNEPNDKSFFSGTTSKLVELTCEAFRILKSIDPAIVVVSPAYTGAQNIVKLEDFLAKGGGKCIDVVAFHLYIPASSPEAFLPVIELVQQAKARQGLEQLPLWNTENGWVFENTDGTPEDKLPADWLRVGSSLSAAFVARAYILASAFGVDRYHWYAWDGGSLGLLEPTAKVPKPGGVALGVVASWMTGSPRPICTEVTTLWQCTLSAGADKQRVAVWSPGTARNYVAPTGWLIQQSERADGRTELNPLPGTSIRTSALPRLLVLVPDTRIR